MSLKRKSTIKEIDFLIKNILELGKDYNNEIIEKNKKIEELQNKFDEKQTTYNDIYEKFDEIQSELNILDKNDQKWTELAYKSDDYGDQLNMIDEEMAYINSLIKSNNEMMELFENKNKELLDKYNQLISEKNNNKKTHTQVQNRVRFGEQDVFGIIPNNPVNIQSQAHLDKYGNPVFFEDLQGTTVTDFDTERGEGMFYTSDKRNYNLEKAKRQDRIEKVREKLEEEQQRLEEEKIFGFIPNKKRSLSSSESSQPSEQTLELQKLRKKSLKPTDEIIEGGSRVKKLLKRTKNILKRVEKILSKKKGTRKMKGGMEESSHPPPSLSQLIPDIEVDKIFTFTVDGEEGEYKVTKLAKIGDNYIINSEKVGSVQPIKLNLIYNPYDHVVTEGSIIPSTFRPLLPHRPRINARRNAMNITGISMPVATRRAENEVAQEIYPEVSHPIPGGTRKHKKSKKKGTRKNKKRMK